MFFAALATDYDGTIAHHGKVDAATVESLEELKRAGRKLILVTGREVPDLRGVFPNLELFDLIVAENGALLLDPAKNEETLLAEPAPAALVARLRKLGVARLSVGRVIVATWEPHETAVLEAIRDLGLELHIIFNKGAVMVLPSDVNKASGLRHALKRLRLSAHNVVGVGDAENDQAFLSACGCAVAVDNALATVKAKCDLVVAGHGAGVSELAHMMIETDLESATVRVPRGQPVLGVRADNTPVHLSPFETVLLAGSPGAGMSTTITALLEQMRDHAFQFCVVDAEGGYGEIGDAVVVGDAKQEPRLAEIMELLAKPDVNVVASLRALDRQERPRFLAKLLPEIAKLRAKTGRPHWIVLDEAHHCLPAKQSPGPAKLPRNLPAAIAVTAHPELLAPRLLADVSVVVGVGEDADRAIRGYCRATGHAVAEGGAVKLRSGQLKILGRDGAVDVITATRPKERRKGRTRK